MRWARAVAASRKGRIALAALACYVLWQVGLSLRAPAKLDPALRVAGVGRVDVLVTLPFPPERFHVLAFQRYGRVSGTADTQLELRGVQPADLTAVARPYWVTRVQPLPAGRTP